MERFPFSNGCMDTSIKIQGDGLRKTMSFSFCIYLWKTMLMVMKTKQFDP